MSSIITLQLNSIFSLEWSCHPPIVTPDMVSRECPLQCVQASEFLQQITWLSAELQLQRPLVANLLVTRDRSPSTSQQITWYHWSSLGHFYITFIIIINLFTSVIYYCCRSEDSVLIYSIHWMSTWRYPVWTQYWVSTWRHPLEHSVVLPYVGCQRGDILDWVSRCQLGDVWLFQGQLGDLWPCIVLDCTHISFYSWHSTLTTDLQHNTRRRWTASKICASEIGTFFFLKFRETFLLTVI